MRLTICLTLICLMQVLSKAKATTGKYTVIAPGTIHCNEKYTAAVAIHHTLLPCEIKLGITGPLYNDTKQVLVAPNEVKHVEFLLPCLENDDYYLTAEGIDCLDNFQNTTALIYHKFYNHVRIQTDKDFYEPGDDINFRVLFLDKDLKPVRPERNALIWIADGKRNRVKKINDFKTIKGVYTGKFKISEFPVTGSWHLGVSNGDGFDRTLHFEVDNYILTNFVVKVEATKSLSVKDGDMQVVVWAKYNYGKPLDGKVTVVLLLEPYNYYKDMKPPALTKTAKMVKGTAKIELSVKEFDAYLPFENSPSSITVVATVEEKLTGVKINGTASSTIYPYRYSINCINYDSYDTFADNKTKDVQFQITYINGSYLTDTTSTVELIYKQALHKNNWWHRERKLDNDSLVSPSSENHAVTFKGHMNETGFVTFNISLVDLPQYESGWHYYSLEIKYLNEQHPVCGTNGYWGVNQVNTYKKDDKFQEYFILEDTYWSDNKIYLKKASQFTLNSSQPLSYFDYNVIGRGNILQSGRIELPDKPKVYNLTFTPEFSWAPNFCVYVNYVDENGKYLFAEQPYEVVFDLENEIYITVAKQAKPDEDVSLKIQTAPNSFVGLMAVDQAAFLLRTEYELNFNELRKVLGSYTSYTYQHDRYSKYPGEVSGCVTLTNADYFSITTQPENITGDFLSASNKRSVIFGNAGEAGHTTYVKATKEYSKTWIFADIENTEASEFFWPIKVPDTITSWVLTAFSLNPQQGLGVTREQSKVTTFLPFFISIRLPYSVKKGEVINVPAWVFNYLDRALDIEVILHNSDDEYEFIEFDHKVVNKQILSKNIRVLDNGVACVSFLLKPKIVGNVMLKFKTISPIAGDGIHKSMNVIYEGITRYANHVYFVNLKNGSEFKSLLELESPEDLTPDSEQIEVEVMGDILGPVFIYLDNLVRWPTGCGEQTMSTMLSNYLVMKYLKDTKRLTFSMETKLRSNLETGYQNILYYRHKNGSFTNFAHTETEENLHTDSTWLTAYVVRYLQQVNEFIDVNSNIIEEGLAFLSQQQVANGTFTEKGGYFHDSQKNHVTLSGAAVLAIMENVTYAKKYSEELTKGLDFIAQNIGESDSLHAQAIGTFTLNKANYATAREELDKLKALAKTGLGHMWWTAGKSQLGRKWLYNVFGNDVEITSYILLALLEQPYTKINDVLPIVNWLISQRNSNGGFSSTQATVVGLTALFEFAKFADFEPTNINVYTAAQEKKETVNLTADNGILYQNIQMPPKSKLIVFDAKGTGSALIQISYKFNVLANDPKPSFIINIAKFYNKNMPLRVHMSVCVFYIGEEDSSNLALLEISTPSGYVIDSESLHETKESRRVISTQLKNDDTLLVLYFNQLYNNNDTCFVVQMIRTHSVAMQKPAHIVLYDYYDTSKKASAFYEIKSTLCDICETEEDCSKCTQ